MKIAWKGKRWLALALAFVLLLSMLPPMEPLAFSEEIGEKPSSEDYKKYIGCDAWFAGYSTPLANDPETAGNPLSVTPFNAYGYENIKLVIEDCYYDATYDALWYKVKAAPGYTLPNEVELKPWVFQDYVLNPWGASLKIAEPETIAGTVTDSNGNPILGSDGQPLTVTVSGGLPEGAIVSASIPEIDGEKLPNVFDIKVLVPDENGELIEWQPIDEGRTVTVSIPVNDLSDGAYVDVTHILDCAQAIHPDVTYLPVGTENAAASALFGEALAVSGRAGYLAVDIYRRVAVKDGMASVQTSSFSVYVPDGTSFKLSETDNAGNVQFDNGGSGSASSASETIYATADTDFSFITKNLVLWDTNDADFFTITKGEEYAEITDQTKPGTLGYVGKKVTADISIDANAPAGTTIWVTFQNSNAYTVAIVIIREVSISFDANLDGVTVNNVPAKQKIPTDGVQAHFNIPTGVGNIPEATNSEEHYVFVGWNTSPAGNGESYDWNGSEFTTKYLIPTKDTTLYAMWEREKCEITFDSNNTSDAKETIVVDYNSNVTMPEPPYNPGFVFLGWCASQSGEGRRYFPAMGDEPADTIQVKADTILYALWGVELRITAVGGTMSVQRDGETSFTSLGVNNTLGFEVKSTTSGGVTTTTYYVVVPEGAYANAYFRFEPAAANKTIRGQGSGSKMEFLKAIGTSNLTGDVLISEAGLTAQTQIDFTAENMMMVSFNPNGGSLKDAAGNIISSVYVNNGATVNLDNYIPIREGYDFAGWYLNEEKKEGNFTVNSDVAFVAKWMPKKYAVTVNPGEGIASVTGSGSYDYASAVKVTATLKPGYSFVNWTGNGVASSSAMEYTFLVPVNGAVVTANATPIDYTITFNLDGGTGVTGSVTYTVKDGVLLPQPTKTSHEFIGWKVTSADGSWVVNDIYDLDALQIESGKYGNVTLTAQWRKTEYTVTWIVGATATVETYKINDPIVMRAVSPQTGYYFAGWTGYTEGMLMPEIDLEFKADIQKIQYTVSFLEANGNPVAGVAAISFNIDDAMAEGFALTLPTPQKSGYNFLGWHTDSALSSEACTVEQLATLLMSQTDSSTVEVKLYARWETALTSLTISVEGLDVTSDPHQVLLFSITGNGVNLTVAVRGNGSVTIDGLTIGQTYTVTLQNAWSWRYGDLEPKEVTITTGENAMEVAVSRTNIYWLDGNDYHSNN